MRIWGWGGRGQTVQFSLAAVLLAALALALPTGALAASRSVSGTVYDDYAELGVQNLNPGQGQVDNGLPGITVKAYDAANKVVGAAKTNAQGRYKLSGLPNGPVRVEVEIPSPYQISEVRSSHGGTAPGGRANTTSTLDSNERYLDDSSSPTGINFGLEIPDEYSVPDPTLFLAEQLDGNGAPTSPDDPAIEEFPYFTPASAVTAGSNGGQDVAPVSKLGTISGLAVDQGTGDVYAAAYFKRDYGVLPSGFYPGLAYPTGAIYRVVPGASANSATVTLFADVNAGTDDPSPDSSWPHVGHEGWGAIAIDPANQNLYAVSLYNHSLYRFPLHGGTVNSTGQVQPASITPIPDPSCSHGDWAPWALGFDPITGALYLGGVCTAATSQSVGDLHAYVYRVNTPTGTPTFTTVLSMPLGYNRLDNNSKEYPTSAATDPVNSDWEPWPTTSSVNPTTYPGGPPDVTRPQRTTPYGKVSEDDESYPALSQIAFDAQGNMILSFRDLMWDMDDGYQPQQNLVTPQGDMLKACTTSSGGWSLESAGVCGGIAGFLPSTNGTPAPGPGSKHGVDDANFGPIGPGNGYFFDPNDSYNQTQPDTTGRDGEPTQELGSVVALAGFQDVVNTQNRASGYGLPGVVWDNDSTGDYTRSAPEGYGPYIQKTNGLGDLAAFASVAPVQIGNRVWKDSRLNCTEDAGDPGIGGVVINLIGRGDATLATATTNRAGEYAFDIQRGTAYKVQINTAQKSLKGLVPTCANKPGVDPRITSKGVVSGRFDSAAVAPLGAGENDFNYDFGFAPPKPLRLTKVASPARPQPGQDVTYTITVRNPGVGALDKVAVCDTLPSGLIYQSSSPTAHASGNRYCWRLATLAGHASRRFTLVARLSSDASSTVTNVATASVKGVFSARARARIRRGPPPKFTG